MTTLIEEGEAISSAGSADSLVVATRGLTKRFRSGQVAVDHIDLAVPRGAVFGFLGPNGSGKTTTIRMLLGLIRPTAGEVTLLGDPMPAHAPRALPKVGALVEGPAFHPYLSGRSNLVRLDRMDGTADPKTHDERIAAALTRVGLTAAASKKFRQYSLGMKQRLGMAAALLQPRELLVLDEPTNGLDPQGTREVRHLVRELAADGLTVFVSSHLLAEVEQVCSHIGIMSAGRLVGQGTIDELRRGGATTVTVATPATGLAVKTLRSLGLADAASSAPDEVRATLDSVAPEEVTAALVHAGVPVRGLALARPALEDLFVELTGEGFDVVR
ncbi:MAG TPA: ATP-binding cassette domain-containing protein [Mycobacteriales bacterium]|nr:ATP-binding cassette domain-containing protein [Mycobacteriales bacterium]